jgi:hypothetical protein
MIKLMLILIHLTSWNEKDNVLDFLLEFKKSQKQKWFISFSYIFSV